jgi:hypothetical protein
MRRQVARWMVGLGVCLVTGSAWAGDIIRELGERGYVVGKITSLPRVGTLGLAVPAGEVHIGPRTVLLDVRTVEPAAVVPGRYAVMPRTGGG